MLFAGINSVWAINDHWSIKFTTFIHKNSNVRCVQIDKVSSLSMFALPRAINLLGKHAYSCRGMQQSIWGGCHISDVLVFQLTYAQRPYKSGRTPRHLSYLLALSCQEVIDNQCLLISSCQHVPRIQLSVLGLSGFTLVGLRNIIFRQK